MALIFKTDFFHLKQLAAKDAQTRDGIRSFQVLLPLIQWVDKRSILVVDEKINSNLLRELGFKHIRIAMDQGHGSDSNTDVKSYLESVRQMFQVRPCSHFYFYPDWRRELQLINFYLVGQFIRAG